MCQLKAAVEFGLQFYWQERKEQFSHDTECKKKKKITWHFIVKFEQLNYPLDCTAWIACIDEMIFFMFV